MSRIRNAAVDAALTQYFESCVNDRKQFEVGLLIGQISASSQTDAIVAAVQVPSETENESAESFEDISTDWMHEYAKHVDRLLPGGLMLLGLYVVSTANARSVFDQASCYLRSLAEACKLPCDFVPHDDIHYILHIAPQSNQTSCKTFFHILDATKTDAVAADLKRHATFSPIQFTTHVRLDEPIAFSRLEETKDAIQVVEERMQQVQEQLQTALKRVWNASGVAEHPSSKAIMLFSPMPSQLPQDVTDIPAHAACGRLQGSVSCLAFVSDKESHPVECAVLYLKKDYIKSVLARLELMVEKWTDDAMDAAEQALQFTFRDGGSLRLPCRGTFAWPSGLMGTQSPVQLLTVHVFPDDDVRVGLRNALEILGASSIKDHQDHEEQDEDDGDVGSFKFLEKAGPEPASVGPFGSKGSMTEPKKPDTATEPQQQPTSSLLLPVALVILLLAFFIQKVVLNG